MTEFRPNTLYKVVYKMITHLWQNRLKFFYQISLRLINVLLFPRCLSLITFLWLEMFRGRISKVGSFSLKLDMEEVYDIVEWCFVRVGSENLGFVDRWIDRACIVFCLSPFPIL